MRILQGYLIAKYGNAGSLILVGRKETLKNDKVDDPTAFAQIKHFDPSNPEYYTLPANVRAAADAINNLGISGPVKKGGPPVPHVVGYETVAGQVALIQKGFGAPLQFGPNTFVIAFYDGGCQIMSLVVPELFLLPAVRACWTQDG